MSAVAPFSERLLRYALRGNAVFSGFSGLMCLLIATHLATTVGIGMSGFRSLGISLLGFAGVLWLLSRQLHRGWVLALVLPVILMDAAWVMGSVVLLQLPSMTTETGQQLVLAVALVVGLLGLLQLVGWVGTLWHRWQHRGRRTAASTAATTLLPLLYLWAGCAPTDLRTEALRQAADPEQLHRQGRQLLHAVAEQQGLAAWQSYRTMEAVGTDRFAPPVTGWWPHPAQRLKLQSLLNTFTSRAELLDGARRGEIWGLHAWQAYHRADSSAAVIPEPPATAPTAETFYLPALQYFNELPFRLLKADYVAYAGTRTHRGKTYDLVLATWGSTGLHPEHDQYLLWINRATQRLDMCHYTLRDVTQVFTGTIHFEDYRNVQGVWMPFTQTVVLPAPEHTLYPLDRYYFHRLTYEAIRFDTVDPAMLITDAAKPTGDFK